MPREPTPSNESAAKPIHIFKQASCLFIHFFTAKQQHEVSPPCASHASCFPTQLVAGWCRDRFSQPLHRSYLQNLPHFQYCRAAKLSGSVLPTLVECPPQKRLGRFRYCVNLAVTSFHFPRSKTLPLKFWVSTAKDSKNTRVLKIKYQRLLKYNCIIYSDMLPRGVTVKRLSYPYALNFFRCKSLQVSPQDPAVFPRPHKPTSSAKSCAFQLIPWVNTNVCINFHGQQVQIPLLGCPFQCRPMFKSFIDWVEGNIAIPSARRSVASSIRSTTLQRTNLWNWRFTNLDHPIPARCFFKGG